MPVGLVDGMEIKSNLNQISIVQHKLEMEIAYAELDAFIPKALKWFRKNIIIDGFRKGKAPDAAIRAQLGEKRVRQRAAEILAGEAFELESKKLDKKPLTPASIDVEDIVDGEPVKFSATYYIDPPSPDEITKQIRDDHYPEIINPEDVFPEGPPGIQSHGPYPLSPDALKNIPGLKLSDQFIPNPIPTMPDPRKASQPPDTNKIDIPDPEKLTNLPKPVSDIKKREPLLTESATSQVEES